MLPTVMVPVRRMQQKWDFPNREGGAEFNVAIARRNTISMGVNC